MEALDTPGWPLLPQGDALLSYVKIWRMAFMHLESQLCSSLLMGGLHRWNPWALLAA